MTFTHKLRAMRRDVRHHSSEKNNRDPRMFSSAVENQNGNNTFQVESLRSMLTMFDNDNGAK
jgi:hypothetical protein